MGPGCPKNLELLLHAKARVPAYMLVAANTTGPSCGLGGALASADPPPSASVPPTLAPEESWRTRAFQEIDVNRTQVIGRIGFGIGKVAGQMILAGKQHGHLIVRHAQNQ